MSDGYSVKNILYIKEGTRECKDLNFGIENKLLYCSLEILFKQSNIRPTMTGEQGHPTAINHFVFVTNSQISSFISINIVTYSLQMF
ncbi:hypothetical protein ANAPC5_01124 [Anaplasma phagocytophilum]|nr:hypothetical protein ANAPC5_01124 [Anaplasma phagocytophilum]